MTEEKKFRFLVPLAAPPPSRRGRPGIYREIIEEFAKSGLEYAEVKDIGRKPTTVTFCLRNHLKKAGIENIRVMLRKKLGKVFLVKTG